MSVTGLLFESRVAGKPVVASFDGGRMSSVGGLLLAMAAERVDSTHIRLFDGQARRVEGAAVGDYDAHKRILGVVCGYEDCNDFDALRNDPMLKIAVGRSPQDGRGLASQPTLSRLENSVGPRELYGMAETLVDMFIESHRGECEPALNTGVCVTFGDG